MKAFVAYLALSAFVVAGAVAAACAVVALKAA